MVDIKDHPKINRQRPTIGVTGPDRGGDVAWLFTSLAIRLAGGKPVRITPEHPRTADGLQGLIVGGGADVDPRTYQQREVVKEYLARTLQNSKKTFWQKVSRFARWFYFPALFVLRKLFSRATGWTLDPARDHLEFQLIDQAVKKNLPVMGICRGSQLVNVYFGGSLYEEIGTFYSEEPNPSSVFPVKKIHIKPGSKLSSVLQVPKLKVNALHHQAIKDPGRGIVVVGQESNGVVQAIENTNCAYLVGVQWHPEYLPQKRVHRRLFQALVQHARMVHEQIEAGDMQEALNSPKAPVLEDLENKEAAQQRQKVE